ncbi:hypothetical protein PF008_g33070 [Phytophthora fragariae]|uniref:Secreted protein n=1 Tax=Phytophthora fragariae TaxID=53985 RepID=A0A6G0PY16_9STRA|nr:hypothetical protein PF008_g33070 [Phytophthora fragariae]
MLLLTISCLLCTQRSNATPYYISRSTYATNASSSWFSSYPITFITPASRWKRLTLPIPGYPTFLALSC